MHYGPGAPLTSILRPPPLTAPRAVGICIEGTEEVADSIHQSLEESEGTYRVRKGSLR